MEENSAYRRSEKLSEKQLKKYEPELDLDIYGLDECPAEHFLINTSEDYFYLVSDNESDFGYPFGIVLPYSEKEGKYYCYGMSEEADNIVSNCCSALKDSIFRSGITGEASKLETIAFIMNEALNAKRNFDGLDFVLINPQNEERPYNGIHDSVENAFNYSIEKYNSDTENSSPLGMIVIMDDKEGHASLAVFDRSNPNKGIGLIDLSYNVHQKQEIKTITDYDGNPFENRITIPAPEVQVPNINMYCLTPPFVEDTSMQEGENCARCVMLLAEVILENCKEFGQVLSSNNTINPFLVEKIFEKGLEENIPISSFFNIEYCQRYVGHELPLYQPDVITESNIEPTGNIGNIRRPELLKPLAVFKIPENIKKSFSQPNLSFVERENLRRKNKQRSNNIPVRLGK